jgi:hypothetical protein
LISATICVLFELRVLLFQGVHQLQNIPVCEGDTWPGESTHSWPHSDSLPLPVADPFGDSFVVPSPLSLTAPPAVENGKNGGGAQWTNFVAVAQPHSAPILNGGSSNFSVYSLKIGIIMNDLDVL